MQTQYERTVYIAREVRVVAIRPKPTQAERIIKVD